MIVAIHEATVNEPSCEEGYCGILHMTVDTSGTTETG